MNNIFSLLPIILVLCVALCVTFILSKKIANAETIEKTHRYASIDGLRGILALFVFVHHCYIYRIYMQSGSWWRPNVAYYGTMGQYSVGLFFMITGFLFTSKIINSKNIDWRKLYVGRIFRLAPVYFFVITIMILISLYRTHFRLQEHFIKLIIQLISTYSFSPIGSIGINHFDSFQIICSVQWSLTYEVLFYLLLPLVALIARKKVPVFYIFLFLLSVLCIIFDIRRGVVVGSISSLFLGGIISSILIYKFPDIKYLRHPIFSVIALILTSILLFDTNDIYSYSGSYRKIALTAIFLIILYGNSMFGFLTNKIVRYLGEMTYSIYLIHGIVLYAIIRNNMFNWGGGINKLSDTEYWALIICVVTPIVIFLSALSYIYIEKPGIKYGNIIINRLKKKQENNAINRNQT